MVHNVLRKILIVISFLLLLAIPATAAAANTNPLDKIDCNAANHSAVCQDRNTHTDPFTGPNGVLHTATDLVAFAAGVAALIFLVLAGIKYITSQGDPAEVSKAKQSIIYAFVGLIIVGLAHQLVSYLISRI
jgi:hypothetical protein